MLDVQSQDDVRKIAIRNVGIRKVRIPIIWHDGDAHSSSIAEFSLSVLLPAEKKGTHMSRFLEALYRTGSEFSVEKIAELTTDVVRALEATSAQSHISFTWFYEKFAPVSNARGIACVDVELQCEILQSGAMVMKQTIRVPVATLCPCSKAISEFGAHNQRSMIHVHTWDTQSSIRQIVSAAEGAASAALYPVLKRADEKFITEQAYKNPKFVEDLVRDAAIAVKAVKGVNRFRIEAENFESIHDHDVWAVVDSLDLDAAVHSP